ncbi:uncharacterized protein BX664DRAFT_38168 [Halteromyces radiatus]|uniref:uncharacterized protein n=1 Tax=Halteromyces radiatus TaxID=101107 RepID=UPI00221FDB4F|nr:uncharacterized protein BX664DRAFT_38168 [Halteromyces radiatus]KAI8078746.1 hypothetical protein BX664DRAFT_38168 [Halteromyces radiatus]
MATATSTQVQPSFNLPFVPSPAKKGWSSSIYAQIQQQQELKTRVETLESQLRRDQHLFEKQRSVLLQEIKMKDTLLLEKDQQWESRWTTKVQQLEEQLDQERQKHENDILDWKKRYEEALDIEQQKHHRRLAYFHERLTAKNMEYAELERQLTTQSAPSSPTQPYYNSLQEQSPRYQRSASLDATAMGTGWMNRPIMRMVRSATRRTSGSIYQQQLQRQNDDDDVIHKNDMYIKEIQDLTLRHQASLDNMMAEYEENRMELQAQHDQEREVWKIKHTAELEEACKRLAQEHEMILEGINTSWQQRWDNLMTQNKMEQAALEQKWDQRLKSEKASWQEQQKKEYAGLKKELLWSKGELSMVNNNNNKGIYIVHSFICFFFFNRYSRNMKMQHV